MSGDRQLVEESAAEFLKRLGADVGDVLFGAPICDRDGRQIESPRYFRITAVGEYRVLARISIINERGEAGAWSTECTVEFSSRDWERFAGHVEVSS